MKKVLLFIFIFFIMFGGYIIYDNYFKINKLSIEEKQIDIDNIYIYGTHLNFNGNIIDDDNLDIVLYNGEFKEYNININDDTFNMSDNFNEGIYLEDIPVGKYYLFLRSSYTNEENEKAYKYYSLNNKTKYKEMIYYTFSKNNRKIIINTDNEYNTLTFNVSKNKDNNIYDIVIDPGHGGKDSGANKNGYYESDLTMKIANNLKSKLEKKGFKAKLTREENQLSRDEKLNDYGTHGRAVIPYEVKAKYLFSIHLNSNVYNYVNGIELYAPYGINYTFISDMAKNISENANVNYSNNKIGKIFDGVYTRVFTESDIKSSKEDFIERNMNPYDITTKSNYYFMIRETGGIITGAYVDNRNKKVGENPYYDSNIGTEAYLLELGYISNLNELNNIVNNIDKYTDAITNTCNKYLNN